jgi:hypothetical protein
VKERRNWRRCPAWSSGGEGGDGEILTNKILTIKNYL